MVNVSVCFQQQSQQTLKYTRVEAVDPMFDSVSINTV